LIPIFRDNSLLLLLADLKVELGVDPFDDIVTDSEKNRLMWIIIIVVVVVLIILIMIIIISYSASRKNKAR